MSKYIQKTFFQYFRLSKLLKQRKAYQKYQILFWYVFQIFEFKQISCMTIQLGLQLSMGIIFSAIQMYVFFLFFFKQLFRQLQLILRKPDQSMKAQFDLDIVLQRFRSKIQQNIQISELQNHMIKRINISREKLAKILADVKQNMLIQYKGINQAPEKLQHLNDTIEKLKDGKYDFAKNNIKLGTQINEFYEEANIPLPFVQKKFACDYCNDKKFKKNQALASHYKGCPQKKKRQSQLYKNCQDQFEEGKIEEEQKEEVKPKKAQVRTVYHVIRPNEQKTEKKQKITQKRPLSTQSFQNIFFQDD